LLNVLDEVLKGERLFALQPRSEPILPPPPDILPPVDLYLMEIEKQMEDLYGLLLQNASTLGLVTFSKVIGGLGRLEAIKRFITLLFLAQTDRVSLWQYEDFGDIYITLKEVQPIGRNDAA